jgi:dihydrolipoamide dehydrogenase
MGGKVALIEKDILGGTCLNRGCIPAKTYLKNAEIIHEIEKAKKRGIIISNPEVNIDMERTVELKNQVVKTLTTGVQGLLKSNGVDIYNGIGRLTKGKKASINGNKLIEGKKIILAGGSKAARIDIPGIESKLVLTSDEILNLKEIPKELVIIGGGAVGVELGAVFSSFGSKVTIIEMMDRIVSNMDEDISTLLEDSLIKKGVKILTSVRLQRITEKNEKLVIEVDKGESMTADKALLSIGRIPDLEGAGDIKFEMEKGRIKVNDYMETNVEGIYAPGDINGKRMLAHAAFKMGEVAAVNAMGGREKNKFELCTQLYIYSSGGCIRRSY